MTGFVQIAAPNISRSAGDNGWTRRVGRCILILYLKRRQNFRKVAPLRKALHQVCTNTRGGDGNLPRLIILISAQRKGNEYARPAKNIDNYGFLYYLTLVLAGIQKPGPSVVAYHFALFNLPPAVGPY